MCYGRIVRWLGHFLGWFVGRVVFVGSFGGGVVVLDTFSIRGVLCGVYTCSGGQSV